MNLQLVQMRILDEVVIAELNVRIDSHASTPDIHLIVVRQGNCMIVPKGDVLDVLWVAGRVRVSIDEINLAGPLHIQSFFLLSTKLPVVVIAPSVYSAFSSQNTCKKVATSHLNNWNIEVDHVWD